VHVVGNLIKVMYPLRGSYGIREKRNKEIREIATVE